MEQTTVVRGTPEAGASSTIGIAGVGTDQATTVIQMPWWQLVGVRVLRVYLQSLLGFLTLPMTGVDAAVGIPLDQFGNAFLVAAMLAVAPTAFTLLQNLFEVLTKLDLKVPQLRA